jgi:glycosyltransferase involved in cell wall biosynthesis
MNEQFISAKCITYARVNLLEEALHSFLQQDYPSDKCEMIIINDYPLQKLIYDHPQVKIFNLNRTFDTIGAKENFATEQCKGNIICQWDDDDVELQNHLSNVNKFFVEGTDLLQWHRGIFYNEPHISAISGLGNAGMVYSKTMWESFGKYPLENAGHDMSFVMGIRGISKNVVFAAPPDEEVSFMYMWGGRGYHLSGQGTDTPNRPNVIIRHCEHVERERKLGRIPTGEIHLKPHWKYDYKQLLADYVRKNKSVHS